MQEKKKSFNFRDFGEKGEKSPYIVIANSPGLETHWEAQPSQREQ